MGTVAAHGLRKSFGDVQALDGVTLDVPDGSFYVVLGPSGAGKTHRNLLTPMTVPHTAGVQFGPPKAPEPHSSF